MTTPCILWTKGVDKDGYGKTYRDGKHWRAHRLRWIDTFGEIPHGMCVCHHCDNPSCINPEHLFLGTILDNNRDKISKGRAPHNVGEKAGGVKLTEDQVIRIREIKLDHSKTARMFGVTRKAISLIRNRQRWAHIL